jgi:hypothetical protein
MGSRAKPDRGKIGKSQRRPDGPTARREGSHRFARLLLMLLYAGSAAISPTIAAPAASDARRVKTGTGFFISHDGFLVTSTHVISGCGGVAVWASGLDQRNARVVAADPRRDIALLSTDGEAVQIATASDHWSPPIGEETFGLGFGVSAKEPRTPRFSRGVLVGESVTPAGDPVLVIQAPVPEGASGGPVLDADGSLVGMMIGYYTDRPDLGVLVSSADINAFLAARGLALPRGPAVGSPVPNLSHILMRISALIQCMPNASGTPSPHLR